MNCTAEITFGNTLKARKTYINIISYSRFGLVLVGPIDSVNGNKWGSERSDLTGEGLNKD